MIIKHLLIGVLLLGQFALAYCANAQEQNDKKYSFAVRPGDSLSKYFSILSIPQLTMFKLLKAHPLNKKLNKLTPNHILILTLDTKRRFKKLSYQVDATHHLIVHYKKGRFKTQYQHSRTNPNKTKAKKINKNWQKIVVKIRNSFFYDGAKAGVAQSVLNKAFKLFSGIVDFKKEIIKGDKFILVLNKGKLLSAHYVNKHRRLDAYLYKGKYYNQDGFKMGKLFSLPLKTYQRISSEFSLRRFHPVLKVYKGHYGTDYAVKTGTPIYAARDGIVRFARTMKGFGKVIYIKHDQKYTTVYAHMSKIHPKIKAKKFIKRGEVIGYVGQTGWATGPHLHFETHVYNSAKNPKTMIGRSLKKKTPKGFKRFKKQVGKINQFII